MLFCPVVSGDIIIAQKKKKKTTLFYLLFTKVLFFSFFNIFRHLGLANSTKKIKPVFGDFCQYNQLFFPLSFKLVLPHPPFVAPLFFVAFLPFLSVFYYRLNAEIFVFPNFYGMMFSPLMAGQSREFSTIRTKSHCIPYLIMVIITSESSCLLCRDSCAQREPTQGSLCAFLIPAHPEQGSGLHV